MVLNFNATSTKLIMTSSRPVLTKGLQKHISCKPTFDPSWDGLTKVATFVSVAKCNQLAKISVAEADWNEDGSVNIPPEVTANVADAVVFGIVGADDSGVVIPTIWCLINSVVNGADADGDNTEVTTATWAKLLSDIGNLEDLDTDAKNNLVEAINEAYNHGGGEQVQSDWNEADTEAPAYIKNKPSIPQTAEDVDALPITGGRINGSLYASGNINADGQINANGNLTVAEDIIVGVNNGVGGIFDTTGNNTEISSKHNLTLTGSKVLIDAATIADENSAVTAKWVEDKNYLSAKAGSAPTGVEMQNVYKDAQGNLVTPTGGGGGGGTLDHRQLTNRDAADQHSISAITGLQTALDGKLPLSAGADYPLAGDLYMAVGSNKRIRRLGDPLSDYDAVNLRTLRSHKASGEYFGGIKADEAQNTDTQPVRIGTDGKLYTAPSSGGASDVFFAVYGETTIAEIEAAVDAGKEVIARSGTNTVTYFQMYTFLRNGNPKRAIFTTEANAHIYMVACSTTGWTQPEDTALATTEYVDSAIAAAIGDTASALAALDNLIGGDEA